jgi:hypothetical protein
MERALSRPLVISRRLRGGWERGVENKDQKRCDIDGAPLWIGPGDQIYCDLVHQQDTKNSVRDEGLEIDRKTQMES